ncbi:MAG: GntR family transcriptional regulator [Treponema sp.]|nr:GntR family transcriptional regulator [Treponema sp.]
MEDIGMAGLESTNTDLSPGLKQAPQAPPRYWQIYEYLLNELSSGKLKPGDQLPSEKELCESFQVSRITSKKALEMLAVNSYISRQRGKGSFVVETPASMELRKKAASFRTIAFLLSTLDDSFGKRLLCSVQAECEALGYQMILKLTNELPAEEEKALRALDNENVAGILMIPTQGEHYNAEILQQILKKRPLVFVDRKMWGLPVPSVTTDNIAATEMAVRGLLEKGHRNIAFYSGPVVHASTLKDRQHGFTMAFANTGYSLNPAYVCSTLHSQDDLAIITRHLSEHPEITAAFATEFRMALLVKKALAALGRQLTPGFTLLTFDCPSYEDEFPEFTCLRQNEEEIGRRAVGILHGIIQGDPDPPTHDILIPAELLP